MLQNKPAALLLIDMQPYCLNQHDEYTKRDKGTLMHQIDSIDLIADEMLMRGFPVIVSEIYGFGSTVSELTSLYGSKTAVPFSGSPGFDYKSFPSVNSSPTTFRDNVKLVVKKNEDAFDGTDLEAHLAGVRTLVIAGVNASFCVKSAAESALARSIEVVISPSLISDPAIDARLGNSLDFYRSQAILLRNPFEILHYLNPVSVTVT
jgi:nicotinamidase-related amidase